MVLRTQTRENLLLFHITFWKWIGGSEQVGGSIPQSHPGPRMPSASLFSRNSNQATWTEQSPCIIHLPSCRKREEVDTKYPLLRAFSCQVVLVVKNPPAKQETRLIPGSGRSLGKGNGKPLQHFAQKTPWTEKPGRLQFMELQRVGQDLATEHVHTSSSGKWGRMVWLSASFVLAALAGEFRQADLPFCNRGWAMWSLSRQPSRVELLSTTT